MKRPNKTGPAWGEFMQRVHYPPAGPAFDALAEAYEAGRKDAAAIVRESKEKSRTGFGHRADLEALAEEIDP